MNDKIVRIKPSNSVFSGHELIIISTDPKYQPNQEQIRNALNGILKEFPDCEITSELLDSIEFMDSGQNFETVSCNHCNQKIQIENWQNQMSQSYENTHFETLDFTTECCNKTTTLNNLIYKSDCGFGSYSITINNAEIKDNKEIELKELMIAALGTEIKLIWKHI